ncbi:MAG: ParB/RepB/Spo0J family partition protein [Proteobacteria bacterium]|nr:ParB/RepB/Spo0J family partition protein [Pseudomonadota bacterium]
MQAKRGLGRGLESLIPPPMVAAEDGALDSAGFRQIPIDRIVPNRLQPRTVFDEERLRELADSIGEQGILQPLAVSPLPDGRYELIAGERRLRASRMAGLEKVPAVVKQVDNEGMLALSIIENIQREDLNPIEEAHAYRELMELFKYTQDDVAKKVGRSRAAVANSVRLLALPQLIQEDVANGRYSAGHARAILAVEKIHDRLKLRERILRDTPTVRDVEKMVQSYASGDNRRRRRKAQLSPQLAEIADNLKQFLGTKVQISTSGVGGRITIDYYSPQDLDRIYTTIACSREAAAACEA